MPDSFALFLAIGILGISAALATAVLFDETRTRRRAIAHYRAMERQRVLRMRRLHDSQGSRPSWDHYVDQKNQRAA
jgi:Tfp pilus assembly protein PilV